MEEFRVFLFVLFLNFAVVDSERSGKMSFVAFLQRVFIFLCEPHWHYSTRQKRHVCALVSGLQRTFCDNQYLHSALAGHTKRNFALTVYRHYHQLYPRKLCSIRFLPRVSLCFCLQANTKLFVFQGWITRLFSLHYLDTSFKFS